MAPKRELSFETIKMIKLIWERNILKLIHNKSLSLKTDVNCYAKKELRLPQSREFNKTKITFIINNKIIYKYNKTPLFDLKKYANNWNYYICSRCYMKHEFLAITEKFSAICFFAMR